LEGAEVSFQFPIDLELKMFMDRFRIGYFDVPENDGLFVVNLREWTGTTNVIQKVKVVRLLQNARMHAGAWARHFEAICGALDDALKHLDKKFPMPPM
jgi:hypothetical protein